MSGRVLVFQHHPASPAGLIAEEAAARGVGLEVIDAETGCDIPADAMARDGLLILGGAMGANDDHVCAHFPDLLELARRFGAAGKPVLGICLGGQLLARAFGGRVHSDRYGEFGFRPTRATAAAATDPLLAGLELPVPLMQWHDDSFDLPADATLLLEGEPCPAQGFRVGRSVWGFQCHLEVTRSDAEIWGELRAQVRGQPEAPVLVRRHLEDGWPVTEAFGRAVAGRWLDLCRR
ncbi:MAG: type 1 glutamine amidotransferase [Geminicoccaceae bacterium]